ncbi:lytic transglycosylase domain-containing protein [Mesorhizobium sp. WSM2239]|uniref:Lytic transglycosylase domain-containing protein n=2 Tax=unclassified Mesorhizobium TaxID=325217 RepID=A0AAU8DHS5_9HYPH
MATQPFIRSIAPLFAATILTSIGAIAPGAAHSSELAERSAAKAFLPVNGDANQGDAISADAVHEARWAKPQRDYALAESGRIVPAEDQVGKINTEPSPTPGGDEWPAPGQYYSDSFFLESASHDSPECGPSPATPEEITRLILEAAQRHKVDVGLALAIASAESRLDRLRNSPKGARGPMQLTPETAERFGVADICDPAANVDGGVRYLRELIEEFRNPLLVAAAYNAGEGRVREHGGIPPFKETVGYVAKVVNFQIGMDGAKPMAGARDAFVDDEQPASNVSGVITSRQRRQWVGGVMHF